MSACYGHRFPVLPYPRCYFPLNVLDPGAFPGASYHLSFWGVPCVIFSGLRRRSQDDFLSGVVGALVADACHKCPRSVRTCHPPSIPPLVGSGR